MSLVTKNIAQGQESAWGVAAAPQSYPRVRTVGLNQDLNTKLVDDTSNTYKGHSKMVNLQNAVEGDITFYAYPDDLPQYLRYVFGNPASEVTADGSGNVYEHIFDQTQVLPSFTVLADKGVKVDRFLGTRGSAVTLSGSNDIVEGSLAAHARDKNDGGAYTPSVISEVDPFTFDQFKLAFDDNLTAAQAKAHTPVDEWEFEYDIDPEKRYQSGSKNASRFDPKIAKLSGSFKLYYDADEWEEFYQEGVEQALYGKLENEDLVIGTASTYKVEFNIPRVQATGNERPYEAGNIIVETVNFEAMYDPSETYMIQAIAQNLTASYAEDIESPSV